MHLLSFDNKTMSFRHCAESLKMLCLIYTPLKNNKRYKKSKNFFVVKRQLRNNSCNYITKGVFYQTHNCVWTTRTKKYCHISLPKGSDFRLRNHLKSRYFIEHGPTKEEKGIAQWAWRSQSERLLGHCPHARIYGVGTGGPAPRF